MLVTSLFSFLHNVFFLSKIPTFSVTFILSSANAFNLDLSKYMSFGNRLTLSKQQILDSSKLEEYATFISNLMKMAESFQIGRKHWGGGENAHFEQFLLFPVFSRLVARLIY